LEKVHSDRELEALPRQLEDTLVGQHGSEVLVLKPGGQPFYSTEGARFPPELLAGSGGRPLRPMLWTDPNNRLFRGISAEVQTGIEGAAPMLVAVSTDMIHHEHFMRSFRVALWTVVGLAALLTGLLGWVVARRGLAPLREIRRNAAGITANRLNQRLSADSLPVELAEVAETLDEMLARLEDSFRRLSDFSSDIAHELRTPVSNLMTQTQVTLSKTRTLNEYHDVLASNMEEFERLSRMISDMLFLAKSDNDLIIPNRELLNLIDEVKSLFEFYEALAEEKTIVLTCSGSGLVPGDRLMLRRAISNLLSNAIRHTPTGGRIAVDVDDTGDSIVKLTVENSGKTIPPEHLPRLFDRFYRADSSRQRLSEGAGLGLAITRSIMRAHGGDAGVRSDGGITAFELTIPVKPVNP
ncbi:MAG: heavy metal sensor histidine kinase, partial [Georgfuchsia sp.]